VQKNVYIDIDVDFFCNPNLQCLYSNTELYSLWTTPRTFYSYIKPAIEPRNVITISKSINGGFTPLLYAFLSDEIKNILNSQSSIYDDHYAYLLRGIQCLQQRRWEEGLKCFDIAAEGKNSISSQIGILYGLLGCSRFKEAQHFYPQVLSNIPRCQHRYLFPICTFVANTDWSKAEHLVNIWLNISPEDTWAVLYKLTILISTGVLDESTCVPLFDILSDESTGFQKQYLLALYHFSRNEYKEAIYSCTAVLDFLEQHETPIWAAQISSFERKKNKGVVLINCYELLSRSFFKSGNMKMAIRYARICKYLGYTNTELKNILNDF
jgi:tetratricopeptide (TPR) repeat protein